MPTDPDAAARHRRRPSPVPTILAFLFAAVALAFVVREAVRFLGPSAPANNPDAVERTPDPRTGHDAEEAEAIRVFKDARESVVNVDTVVLVRRLDMSVQERQTGTGSGFVWDDDGRVVTNFHVVKEAAARRVGLRVVLADRTAWDARIVGIAPEFDLAVLQIATPGRKLPKIKVGRSNDLEVGQKVYAIGNPFGLSLSMTKGIISALDREIDSLTDQTISGAIQTDAPINPGNSGGPLLDKDGRLIGVNTSIASPSGGNVGIGFAIPVDTVNTVVTELIQRGRVLKPDLGAKFVDERRLRRAGFPTGVMVQDVLPAGAAAKAGLRGVRVDPRSGDVEPGDLILAVNGEGVPTVQELTRVLRKHKIGDKVKLTLERDGKQQQVEVELGGA
jgi:S1-C subfamily serine protease